MAKKTTTARAARAEKMVTVPVKTVVLKRLRQPYPPGKRYIADSEAIRDHWENFMKENPIAEPRQDDGIKNGYRRYPIHLLDRSKLKYEVKDGEAVIFRDADNGEVVGFVSTYVFPDEEVLKVLNGTLTTHLNLTLRSVRGNDPGYIVGVGYTSGSRHQRSLAWVNNLGDYADKLSHQYKVSCAFAHVWGQSRKHLPKEVSDDFDQASRDLDGLVMDGGVRLRGGGKLRYEMEIFGKKHKFETSDLAPAAGVCAINYCRYPHNEVNFNKYCCSFSTSRTHGEEYGANFFIAQYGIRIPGRENRFVVWRGADFHGTSLSLVKPLDFDPEFKQIGLAFIIPNGIKGELEREKRDGVTYEGPVPLKKTIELNDSEVKPIQRQTMKIFRPVTDRKKKVFQAQHKEVIFLPSSHAYEGFAKNQLIAECSERVRAGKLKNYATGWKWSRLVAELLTNDGCKVDIRQYRPDGKQVILSGRTYKVIDDAASDIDPMDCIQERREESYLSDSSEEVDWENENWQKKIADEIRERNVKTRMYEMTLEKKEDERKLKFIKGEIVTFRPRATRSSAKSGPKKNKVTKQTSALASPSKRLTRAATKNQDTLKVLSQPILSAKTSNASSTPKSTIWSTKIRVIESQSAKRMTRNSKK